MADGAENFAAVAETTVSVQYFKNMPDGRQIGKITYPLERYSALVSSSGFGGERSIHRNRAVGWNQIDALAQIIPPLQRRDFGP